MALTFTTPILLAITFLFSYQPNEAVVLPLQSFGKDGENVPSFLDSRPSDTFFSQSLQRSLIKRNDYTGTVDLKALRANQVDLDSKGTSFFLTLLNKSDANSCVVISAMENGFIENYLIRLPPWSDQTIDVRELLFFDSVSFISIQDFESKLVLENGFGGAYDHDVTINPPIRAERTYNYYADVISRILRVAVKPEVAGYYEDAWFVRVYVGDRPGGSSCQIYPPPLPIHIINVYWPT